MGDQLGEGRSGEGAEVTAELVGRLGFDPGRLPRELARHYLPAGEADIREMLASVGAGSLEALFEHLPEAVRVRGELALPEELPYGEVAAALEAVAGKNRRLESYLGDGLPDFSVPGVVGEVASVRNLSTAYTPYQPERSQGTLMTHWIYQCLMSQLTGFEAINASLYDRATAIFEAVTAALRLERKAEAAIVPEGLYPGDLEVIQTLAADTPVELVKIPLDPATGRVDAAATAAAVEGLGERLGAVVINQVNCFGLLEDVDLLTDLATRNERNRARGIAVVDPVLLATGALKPPTLWGAAGADFVVGEAQHLALGPNFGGPGLGLFGVRHDAAHRNDIRATPGRYVGKARDLAGRDCRVIVLSTREQHIRKEKATSNICSNQAFVATLAGAALLERGDDGLREAAARAREQAVEAAGRLAALPGLSLAFPGSPFFNEFTLELPRPAAEAIAAGREHGLHVGVDVTGRPGGGGRHLLKLSFSDHERDLDRLGSFFAGWVGAEKGGVGAGAGPSAVPSPGPPAAGVPEIPAGLRREGTVGLPQFPREEVAAYYRRLGELNVSPDDACYPLGSCTMKYNPHLNDWAAGLAGFTGAHPQAPAEDVQGSLEVFYEIQEWFKAITGLPAVTTQPLAGAQGELVGLKLFQAYHRERGEAHRDVVLIPRSAHGTNFATAAAAGFVSGMAGGRRTGIVTLEADPEGRIDPDDLEAKLAEHGAHLSGVMVTNPNTSGIFETGFREMADKVHAAGGLVYMDGANMNAVAGWVDLGAMGVDAVHNNLHKTWTIPHGGGGPGDAIVAVSARLADFLPGRQVVRGGDGHFRPVRPPKSIGSFHRHWGNAAHKVRCYAYLLRLGRAGVRRMSALAVLSSRYLFERLKRTYPTLPEGAAAVPRMHEFILTLGEEDFDRIEAAGVPRAAAVVRVGKLYLDFGFHAPTVAWPEAFGLMIEPTESYTKAELDRFGEAVEAIGGLVREHPEVLRDVPHFTPVDRVDEVDANRHLCLSERLGSLPEINPNRVSPAELAALPVAAVRERVVAERK